MKAFARIISFGLYCALLVGGAFVYGVRRRTPAFAYHSMIRLFCMTGGYSNDCLSRLIGLARPRLEFRGARGVIGNTDDVAARASAVLALKERGYYVFENLLDEVVCDRLLAYATSQPCEPRRMDNQKSCDSVTAIYHRDRPKAVRYDFSTGQLLRNADVQNLMADLSLAAVAQDYLGARPIIDVVSMWWLTSFSENPDAQAAQFFHFDMDRPKWLKFFIYLGDVTTLNGPHMYVAGSHRSGGIPPRLLKKGYARLSDEEVSQSFGQKAITEVVARRGTILAEDTRGLHKGKRVLRGDRLLLQIQYSNSLFGAWYAKEAIGRHMTAELRARVEEFPDIYSAYL
ncbi:MAG: phytanoyl-CoA dioxygenase family protein [Candidatus Micrarchaeaceae archaeon]